VLSAVGVRAGTSRVRNALGKGGLIFVDVPNEASLAMMPGNLYMRTRGRDWAVSLSPTLPFHVVGFTPSSLRRALALTGVPVVRLKQFRWPNLLPSATCLVRRSERGGVSAASWAEKRVGMRDGICRWAAAE
jgi:hypothetical protein